MSDLPEKILLEIERSDSVGVKSLDLAKIFSTDHQRIVGAIKSLECLDGMIEADMESVKRWDLTKEGELVAEKGSHEAIVWGLVGEGIAQPDLMKAAGSMGKVGFSKAMSAGWIVLDKSGGKPLVKRKVAEIEDVIQKHLVKVKSGEGDNIHEKERAEYKKRKLVQEVTEKIYSLKKGPNFSTTISKAETELTPEMITAGTWKTANFKPYNFNALGISPSGGHLHPLLKVRAEYRQIFLEMGFTEMPTNNYVESSFWNFDALFQPQQHPARDAHDTFFVSDPAETTIFPEEYLERVRKVHSDGGFGSQGYGYDWKKQEASKNLLRTHTTAVSARMLYKLAQQEKFKPQKYFSIDRVFRNETLDATHLAEFHQIEGVIADKDLTLGDLIGVLYQFFQKLGIEKLRFKPAYNPYTEPSMEIFSYHEGLGKWVEIGNSGVFRPEMLLPMGLPEDVKVIAWGLSLERPTMIKYKIDNIRDLVGHKVDLNMVQRNPLCRI
jgi:phenylalanyl-tRNA synthetase alpha chain